MSKKSERIEILQKAADALFGYAHRYKPVQATISGSGPRWNSGNKLDPMSVRVHHDAIWDAELRFDYETGKAAIHHGGATRDLQNAMMFAEDVRLLALLGARLEMLGRSLLPLESSRRR